VVWRTERTCCARQGRQVSSALAGLARHVSLSRKRQNAKSPFHGCDLPIIIAWFASFPKCLGCRGVIVILYGILGLDDRPTQRDSCCSSRLFLILLGPHPARQGRRARRSARRRRRIKPLWARARAISHAHHDLRRCDLAAPYHDSGACHPEQRSRVPLNPDLQQGR